MGGGKRAVKCRCENVVFGWCLCFFLFCFFVSFSLFNFSQSVQHCAVNDRPVLFLIEAGVRSHPYILSRCWNITRLFLYFAQTSR